LVCIVRFIGHFNRILGSIYEIDGYCFYRDMEIPIEFSGNGDTLTPPKLKKDASQLDRLKPVRNVGITTTGIWDRWAKCRKQPFV